MAEAPRSLVELRRDLDAGAVSSRELVDAARILVDATN